MVATVEMEKMPLEESLKTMLAEVQMAATVEVIRIRR